MKRLSALLLLSLCGAQCGDSDNAQSTVVADSPPLPLRPASQLCNDPSDLADARWRPDSLLVVWAPSAIEAADAFAEQIYEPEAVPRARQMYRRYNAIAKAASTPGSGGRNAAVEKAWQDALDLSREALAARLARKPPPPAYALPPGYAVEDVASELAIHIAFILAANDHDHAAFRRRMAEALGSSAPGSPVRRLSESEFSRAAVAELRESNPSQGFVRAMVLQFLLDGRPEAAERAMRALIYWHADPSGRTYYYPLDAASMREKLLDPGTDFGELVSAPPKVERLDDCSDLFAFYVEWLDLQSHVAAPDGPAAQRRRLLGEIRRFRSNTPAPLIGRRYVAALDAAAARLS
jgi:hypothetical protein